MSQFPSRFHTLLSAKQQENNRLSSTKKSFPYTLMHSINMFKFLGQHANKEHLLFATVSIRYSAAGYLNVQVILVRFYLIMEIKKHHFFVTFAFIVVFQTFNWIFSLCGWLWREKDGKYSCFLYVRFGRQRLVLNIKPNNTIKLKLISIEKRSYKHEEILFILNKKKD